MATMELVKPRPTREFMTIAEAREWYAIGRATLFRMLSSGELHKHTRPHDRKTYLSVEELERVLKPTRE